MKKINLMVFLLVFISLFILSGTILANESEVKPQIYFFNDYPEHMEFLWAIVGTPRKDYNSTLLPIEIIVYNSSHKALEVVYLSYFFYYAKENKIISAYNFSNIASNLWLPYSSIYKASEIYYFHEDMPDYIFIYPTYIQPYKENPCETSDKDSVLKFISSILKLDAFMILEAEYY